MDEEEFQKRQEKLIELCPEVDSILYAMKEYIDISFFRYVKSFPDGEKYIVSNNAEWLKAYFREKFYDTELASYHKHPDGSKGVSIHSKCLLNHKNCQFWNQQEGIGNYKNIMTFFIKFDKYLEMYNFGIDGDIHESNMKFLNNQSIFRHFFLYFKSRGQVILQAARQNSFQIHIDEAFDLNENWFLGIDKQRKTIALHEMPLLELYLDNQFDDVALSLTEARSLRFFLEGFKFSEAPHLLGISEARHIDNLTKVMGKLNSKSYTDLRSLCHKTNIARKLGFLHLDHSR